MQLLPTTLAPVLRWSSFWRPALGPCAKASTSRVPESEVKGSTFSVGPSRHGGGKVAGRWDLCGPGDCRRRTPCPSKAEWSTQGTRLPWACRLSTLQHLEGSLPGETKSRQLRSKPAILPGHRSLPFSCLFSSQGPGMSHPWGHHCHYLRKCNISPSLLRVHTQGFVVPKPGLFPVPLLQKPLRGRGRGRKACGLGLVLQYPRGSQLYQEGVVKILKHSSHETSLCSPRRTHYSVLTQQTFTEGVPSQTSGRPSFKMQGGQQRAGSTGSGHRT